MCQSTETRGNDSEKKTLRPQPTASSRLWSRGLHPVGALSVPPPVQIPLAQTEWKNETTKKNKTPNGCPNSTQTTADYVEEDFFRVTLPHRAKTVGKSTHLDIGPKGSTGVVGSLAVLMHRLHPLHHHVSLSDGFRGRFRLVVRDGIAGEKVSRRPRCGDLELLEICPRGNNKSFIIIFPCS